MKSMKNYAAIILALIAFDLYGQAISMSRFLFEPVIKPLDYRPPQDYNASRGRGGHHGVDNRVTPNVHGNPSAYGNNPMDFNATIDQNALTYNMPFGQLYLGSNLPIKSMTVGNPLNSANERWHTPYGPDIVRQNLDRFTPPDNRYNPNLTLSGTITESPWEFYASPQVSMADPLNGIRNMNANSHRPMSGERLPVHLPTSANAGDPFNTNPLGGYFVNDTRLTSMTWDTLGHDIRLQDGAIDYEMRMERNDTMEMGGYYQDGMATSASGEADFSCAGHLLGTPAAYNHAWEKRHFSSLSRAGMDAKRSIPLDGIYAFIDDVNPVNIHDFHRSGANKLEKAMHWAYPYGNDNFKPIFNVGWAWRMPLVNGDGGTGSGNYEAIGGTVESLDLCTHYGVIGGGAADWGNEKYGATAGIQAANTGNANQLAVPGGPYANPMMVTGTTSRLSVGQDPIGNPITYVERVEDLNGTATQLAGHPLELPGSSLSPWNPDFGYDLSRFFGDFYVEPSVWTANNNLAANPNVNTGVQVNREAGNPDFQNPLDRRNQVSTRSMTDVLRMGDMRRKIRHINRFPTATIDYLFQSGYTAPANGNRIPVYTQ